jgi:hypothetical protein
MLTVGFVRRDAKLSFVALRLDRVLRCTLYHIHLLVSMYNDSDNPSFISAKE